MPFCSCAQHSSAFRFPYLLLTLLPLSTSPFPLPSFLLLIFLFPVFLVAAFFVSLWPAVVELGQSTEPWSSTAAHRAVYWRFCEAGLDTQNPELESQWSWIGNVMNPRLRSLIVCLSTGLNCSTDFHETWWKHGTRAIWLRSGIIRTSCIHQKTQKTILIK